MLSQFGRGNGRGFAARRRWPRGVFPAVLALCAGTWALVFVLPSGAASTANDGCGYASSSFNESYILRWAQLNGSGLSATFGTYVNDEKGLLLGVNGATPMSGATQNGSNGQSGGASYHVSGASGGSTTATDPSGRPYFPGLYITNLTAHPLNSDGTGAGDFQHGGGARNIAGGVPFVDDVFGTWATATVSGSTYKVTPPLDKNNWNLGTGSDAPVGTAFSAMGNEGFGAEARWSIGELSDSDGHALQPGNTYRIQVIIHDGDQNKSGGDSGEFCSTLSIAQAEPTLRTTASNGTAGGTIQDQATLAGGANPTGKITWNVYAGSDSACSSPLNAQPSALTTAVTGNGTFSSPTYTPSAPGSYKWIATYSGDTANKSVSTSCNDPNEISQVTESASPGISLRKTERIGSATFTHGPVTGSVGNRVDYRMLVTNTGNTRLVISFTDRQCDSGTLSGPSVVAGSYEAATRTLSAGGQLLYTCSHVLAAGDQPYTNTASVTGQPPSGPPVSAHDSVKAYANTPGIRVVKLEKVAGAGGGFTRGPVTVTERSGHYVIHTIDYRIRVTNTGSVLLGLNLKDPRCDAGTVQGPVVVSGTLMGGLLSPGGQAQYTCSHRYVKGDPAPFYNVATVTGTPPFGPSVSGTSTVKANRKSVEAKHVCRSLRTGRVIRYRGHRKPRACLPRNPHHPRGFTG